MQPAVEASWLPSWPLVGLVIVLAVGGSWLAVRMGRAPALRRAQRWLLPASVIAWAAAAWLAILRFVVMPSVLETAARGLVVLSGVAIALPLLRDVAAGFVLVIEGRHRIGDDLRVGDHEGRLVALGLRSAVMRDRSGTEVTVPYHRMARQEVVRLNLERHDAPCDFELSLPASADLEEVTRRLQEAALLSPYAAPGRRPEVFAVADIEGSVRLRVRAYVFDRAHEERYRGDVLARAGLTR